MAANPQTGAASAEAVFDRVRKVLMHEHRTGCLDRAAVGGLERFVRSVAPPGGAPAAQAWLTTASGELVNYGEQPPATRQEIVSRLLRHLDAPPAAPTSGPSETAPNGAPQAGGPLLEVPPASLPGPPVPNTAVASPARPARAQARALPAVPLQAPVGDLPGVGPRAVTALGRLDVHSVRDLLYHLPRRHLDRRGVTPMANLVPGVEATVFGTVWQVQTRRRGQAHGLTITEAILQDETGYCHAVWFNQPYLVRTLSRPGRVVFSGKVEVASGGGVQLISPEFEYDSDDLLHTGRLVPFYGKTEGLSDKQLRTWVRLALDSSREQVRDPLPPDVIEGARLFDLATALEQAHFPTDDDALVGARRRLAFDELLLIQLGVLRRRREWQEGEPGLEMPAEPGLWEEFESLLPFRLTDAQRRVCAEVAGDMARPVPMSRLLQGDVGSGKTVVAAGACLVAVRHGYQAALMAPTEVLAQQHFRTVERLLSPFGLKVGLITGSLRRAEKNRVWAACTAGEVDVLVGTHALIQDEGSFRSLGLAVVDEQHRFGVRQRGALRRKGYHPDLLVMTATPIPRTLALSLYGDLDVSVIDEMPPGRREIKTFPVSPDHRHRAYDFLRRQVRNGRQGFIICPLIDESDKIEARAAKGEYERLQRQFPDLRLALLHGKMPPREKEQVMVAFRDGFVDVLVSTAVVEVGIDVPNATVMLIEGADRFGLSQLHQFRGRVGRGEHQSYCLLLSDSAGAESNPRLQAVVRNQDGFALAEEDLKLRGPGEFFGTRQSGLPDLRVARLSDVAILEEARRQAQRLDARDPGLTQPQHALLRASVDAFWQHAESAS